MKFLINFLSIFGGVGNSILGLISSTMQKGFQAAIQFHKEGIAFARDAGLSAKQAQAYTNTLIQRTEVLANRYGVSAEAIMQVQRGISEATGKQLLLNDAQAEGFVRINKLVGAQASARFQEEMMNGMGGQIDAVEGAISKTYATAMKQGLNAKKLTDKVAQNLGMANRLSFRNGIDGLIRMTALSEKLGMNMQSVESAAGQFLELDKAIENAAQMQMLGGSAAANFGNPLLASYEANYDPEAFAQRLSDSLASYATFDASKGISSINGMNMDFVRNIAKAMGISAEEASRMAKKQAEVQYKENKLSPLLNSVAGGDEARRNYILNNAQVTNNGRDMEIQGKNIKDFTDKEWDEMLRIGNMSDEEIMKEQALRLTSIDEQISGASASVAAGFAEGLEKYMPGIQQKIKDLGDYMTGWSKQWGASTGRVVGAAMDWLNRNGPTIRTVADAILSKVTAVIDFLSKNWKGLLIAIAGWKLLLKPLLGGILTGGIGKGGGGLVARAGKGIWNGAKWAGRGIWNGAKWAGRGLLNGARMAGRGLGRGAVGAAHGLGSLGSKMWGSGLIGPGRDFYNYNKAMYGGSKMKNILGAARQSWQSASKLTKLSAGVGVAISAVQGLSAIGEYSKNKKQLQAQLDSGAISKADYDAQINEARVNKNEKVGGAVGTAVGTVIGTAIGGPLGAAIGGWLGNEGGKLIGKHWDSICETASNVWNGIKNVASNVWEGTKSLAKGAWDTMTKVGRGAFNAISQAANTIWDSVRNVASAVFDNVKNAWNVVTEGARNVLTGIGNVVKGAWNAVTEGARTVVTGIGNTVKNAWNGITEGARVVASRIGSAIEGAYSRAKTIAKEGYEGAKTVVGDSYKGVKTVVGDVYKGVKTVIGDASSFVRNILSNSNDVKAKPVGGKEYIYKPNGASKNGVTELTVKDINLNVSGTIKLDGGNGSKNVDINKLLEDTKFISSLKDLIKQSINNDINNGRFMNDMASMRGMPSQVTVWGRK